MSNKLLVGFEKFIFGIRWLQAPIYLLLSLILVAFIYEMFHELGHLFLHLHDFDEEKLVVLALTLCDAVLVANLVVMVIISGYENFVYRISMNDDTGKPLWIKKLSPNAVKIKIAGSIIAISSISLLKEFLEISQTSDRNLMWGAIIHMIFVVSALLIAITYYIEKKTAKLAEK